MNTRLDTCHRYISLQHFFPPKSTRSYIKKSIYISNKANHWGHMSPNGASQLSRHIGNEVANLI
ncbi:hypothetical protein HanHA300_Chr17g0647021 [Helianthus annuus]|nr:hypothetical protein HanHA300_Chr17g0647021 [Helianthus annuus]KAJ0446857.1 hypothetical protein HanHA89_Chr17g0698921 [Helianthus annuus]